MRLRDEIVFRRVELIGRQNESWFLPFDEDIWPQPGKWKKTGLNVYLICVLLNRHGVRRPNKIRTHKSIRFFFTETGWEKAGRPILHTIKRWGLEHRVLRIKEKSVDVIYRDDLQVAVRPRRRDDK